MTSAGTPEAISGGEHFVDLKVNNSCAFPWPPSKFTIKTQVGCTLSELRKKIADHTHYEIEAFDIFVHGKRIVSEQENQALKNFNLGTKGIVTITRRPGTRNEAFGDDLKKGEPVIGLKPSYPLSIPARSHKQPAYADVLKKISQTSPAGTASPSFFSGPSGSLGQSSGFVGLSNQGATCYMNSLIQSLYMTPEFRAALYKWDFNSTYEKWKRENEALIQKEIEHNAASNKNVNEEETEKMRRLDREKVSIPRQLQLLFARLQLSGQKAVKTKDLTNSFGWKDSDAFTQHDVQELCRVLFDALEKVLRGTEQENMITELYEGELKDYVKCEECKNESSRADKFLDVPLVIRGFGSKKAIGSVEEALKKFVQPERLTGDNKYSCEKCNKKTNAKKGLKFSRFPYLLTLQLKRFDFDYELSRRVKLPDRVTFPMVLDMNQFMEDDSSSSDNLTETNVYELFSVLVHRGSALGGHYYAYIKSFEKDKWHEFNDSQVREVSEADVQKTYGEAPKEGQQRTGVMSVLQSSENAYMLMYRRIDTSKNKLAVAASEVPVELHQAVRAEIEATKKKAEEAVREKSMITLNVYHHGEQRAIKLHKGTFLGDAVKQCAALFADLSLCPEGSVRLRAYDPLKDIPLEPIGSRSDAVLESLNLRPQQNVLLETKGTSENFPEWNPNDLVLWVILYDDIAKQFGKPEHIAISKNAKVADLKAKLEAKYAIPAAKQRLVRESKASNSGRVLGDSVQFSQQPVIPSGTTIYLEYCEDPKSESASVKEIERIRSSMEICFNLIGQKEFDQQLEVSKKLKYKELKVLLEPIIKIPADQFKLSKYHFSFVSPVRDEEETLEKLPSGAKLLVEKGRHLKLGEVLVTFFLFDPENKRGSEHFVELFDMGIDEDVRLTDVLVLLAKRLKDEKNIDINPEHMRIREKTATAPSIIYDHEKSYKENVTTTAGKSLAIEELNEKVKPRNEGDLFIYVQQFFPSRFELSKKVEVRADENALVDDFKKSLAEKYQIKNVSLTKGSWLKPKLLELPNQFENSDFKLKEERKKLDAPTLEGSPFYLRDGDILLFMDADEEFKELTDEERKKLEPEIKVRRNFYKEEALTINANS
eukprot:TRINITY_DN2135_c0_g1_i3.p1 TRINITY_DN2135_c0_g1~~TRINITY_DN2135_c0_g1_i3.p1  ORF type:complete len:1106 (+),score=339.91 TRINITY_DN2135_c0_g1_i3:161-3478(+)